MTSRRVWTADEITEQADQLAAALMNDIVPASIGGFVGGFLFGTPLVPRKRKQLRKGQPSSDDPDK